jgi:hypothetical protein
MKLPARFIGDATGVVSPDENQLTPLSDASELNQAEADPNVADPITLPWYQNAYQTYLKATGQLNSDGTGDGSGFWTSPIALGLYAVGGIALVGFLLNSPVIAAAIERKKS